MTQSTRILFWLLRKPIVVGVILSSVVFFLISLVNPQPGFRTVVSSVALTMVGTLHMNLSAWLTRLPVPVTDRQLAWIPMSIWAAFTLCAIIGVALGQLLGVLGWPDYDAEDLMAFWQMLPAAFLAISFMALVIWRLARLYSGAGFIGIYILLIKPSEAGTNSWWLDWLYAFWPVWLVGSLVIIWEAPYIASISRRMDGRTAADYGNDLFPKRESGPVFHYIQNRVISSLIALFAVYIMVAAIVQSWTDVAREFSEHPALFALLGLLGFPLHSIWRTIRANGYAGSQAMIRLLLMSTVVGYFFRDLVGVKSGKVVNCGTCKQPKLIWQSQCPHCLEQCPWVSQIGYFSWFTRDINAKHDPLAFWFRVIMPIILIFYIFMANWRAWFGS